MANPDPALGSFNAAPAPDAERDVYACCASTRFAKAVAAGQTLQQAQASVLMEDYRDWEFYEAQRAQNVAGTYRALASQR